MTTLHELIVQLNEHLILDKRNNGDEFYLLKKDSPQWMTDVIYAAHNHNAPDDTIYEFIHKIVQHLSEYDAELSEDDLRDKLDNIESDVYTSALTGWLHANINHLQYVTDALEEYGIFDNGFDLLQMAQNIQIIEIGEILLNEISKRVDQ